MTLEGTATAVLLLVNETWKPPLEAAAVRLTVQLTEPEPVTELLLQERELSEAVTPAAPAFFPFPLRATVVLGAVFESFVMVRVPVDEAACFGL